MAILCNTFLKRKKKQSELNNFLRNVLINFTRMRFCDTGCDTGHVTLCYSLKKQKTKKR